MAALENIDFERIVLASMVFDPSLSGQGRATGVSEKHFFLPFHRKLYALLQTLEEDEILDEEMIRARMGRSFDESAMLAIAAANPAHSLGHYLEEIKRLAYLREARTAATSILHRIDEETDASESEILKLFSEHADRLERDAGSLLAIRDISEIEAKEAEFVCKSWLPFPKRAVSIVSAGGGAGKSFLMMQAAMRMVSEEGLKVFMWLSEDPAELSKFRFDMIADKVLGLEPERVRNRLFLAGSDVDTPHLLRMERGDAVVDGAFYQIKKMLSDFDVIVFDPLIAFFGGDENDNTHARRFINLFSRWANIEDKTIVFIHHGTKNSSQSRGASAFVDAVRLAYQVDIVKNSDGEQVEEHNRMITLAKDNNGAKKYFGAHRAKRKVFPEKEMQNLKIEMHPLG